MMGKFYELRNGKRIKIYCVFCGKEINNPTMKRITCGKKDCLKKQSALHRDFRIIDKGSKGCIN